MPREAIFDPRHCRPAGTLVDVGHDGSLRPKFAGSGVALRGEGFLRVLLGALVVGLAVRSARHLVDEDDALRRLEPGELRLDVGDHVGLVDRVPSVAATGSDGLAEPFVVDPDDQAIPHARYALDCLLDLFGEDLLAAGVDHLAASAEQDQRAVGGDLGEVAGNE